MLPVINGVVIRVLDDHPGVADDRLMARQVQPSKIPNWFPGGNKRPASSEINSAKKKAER